LRDKARMIAKAEHLVRPSLASGHVAR